MQESFGKKAELDGQCQYFWAALCSSLSICCKCCLKQGISIKGFIYFLHYSRTLCPCKLFRSRMWSKGWNQPFNACIDLFELCGNSFSGNHFILTKNESKNSWDGNKKSLLKYWIIKNWSGDCGRYGADDIKNEKFDSRSNEMHLAEFCVGLQE